MPEGLIPPVVATFAADYAQMLAGGDSVIGTLRQVGETAVQTSTTATEALDRLGGAAETADGQLSLFGENATRAAEQLALFAAEADKVAAQVATDETTIAAGATTMAAGVEAAMARGQAALDKLSITQAGDAAVWERSMATESASIDLMVANLQAQAVKAETSIGTLGAAMKTTSTKAVTLSSASTAMYGTTATAIGGAAIKAGAAAAVIAGVTVDMAGKFDQQMELIKTQAHDSTDNIQALSQSVLQMAGDVGQAPDKLAEGLYHITSTGQTGAAALDILKNSAKDATIGIADLDTVTYAMSGVMSVGMSDVKNAADGVAFLNTIVGQGDMHMQDLANAVGTGVLPAFKSAGLGMADFGAALSTLTDNSTPAEVAANHLKTTVQLLQNQSKPAASALADLGIKTGELGADISKPGGLMVAVMDLKTHMDQYTKSAGGMKLSTAQINTAVQQMAGELTKEGVATGQQTDLLNAYRDSLGKMGSAGIQAAADLSKAFGGARSAMTMETLVQESGKLQTKYSEMGTAASRQSQAQQDWNNTQAQFKTKLADTKSAAEALGISVGNLLLPFVTKVMDGFKSFSDVLIKHQGIAKALAVVIGGALLAAMVAIVGATVAWAIAIQGTPLGWIFDIIAGLTLLVAVIVANWSNIAGFFSDVWHAITGFFTDAWHVIQNVAKFIGGIPADIGHFFESLPGVLGNLLSKAGQAMLTGIKQQATDLLNFVKNLPHEIGYAIGFLAGILYRAGSAAIHSLVTGITDQAKGLYQFFVDLPGNIKKFLQDAQNWISDTGQKIITGLIIGITTSFWDVVHWFQNLPGNIKKFLTSAAEWLLGPGTQMLKGFGLGIVAGFWDVIHWFEALPGNVGSFFKDVGNWLVNAGGDLVHGLLKGIENAGSWLMQQITSFAKGIVSGFLSAFGIHSPATTTQPVGAGIVMGIAKGVQDNLHITAAAAKSAVSSVMGAFGSAGGLGSIGVNATSSLNVTGGVTSSASSAPIQVNIVMNQRDWQKAIQTGRLQYDLRNTGNGLAVVGR